MCFVQMWAKTKIIKDLKDAPYSYNLTTFNVWGNIIFLFVYWVLIVQNGSNKDETGLKRSKLQVLGVTTPIHISVNPQSTFVEKDEKKWKKSRSQ